MKVLGEFAVPAVFSATLLAFTATWSPAVLAAGTLADAARADDLPLSRQLLTAGADVDLPAADGTTPLLWAVYNTSTPLVQLLLDAGADADIANDLGISPLLQAGRHGNAALLRALLAGGASLHAPDATVEPVLMAAARSGNVEAVQVLLQAGADPNATEPLDQQTALMWAAAQGHLDVAATLLQAGANANAQARVSELTVRKNADFPTGGFAALHWAARNGDEAMIGLLLAQGADINARNGDGSTPMMLAIVNDRFDVAAQLLQHGADADDGSLYYITEMRDATTDWRARDGTIFRADHANRLEALALMRLLLEAGANPDKPFVGQMHNTSMCCDTRVNATPFYRAASAADVDALQLMLAHGAGTDWTPAPPPPADPDDLAPVVNNAGKSALMMAINGGKGVGVAGGPNDLRQGPPQFREDGNRDTLQAVRLLLAAGADVDARDGNQETALHVAVKALHPDIVRALVQEGASLDAANKDGQTPLQVAEKMEAPKPTPGFYFQPPKAQPTEIAALLRQLAAERTQ